jgi:Flp pilus assembly protein TadG
MKTPSTASIRQRRKGGAAVEMAIVLPLLVLFLAVPLFFGRVFWYYSVAQKAAHDAARFLSATTQTEIRGSGSGGEAPVAALARAIAVSELNGIRAGLDGWTITVLCDFNTCGMALPETVRVSVWITVRDGIFGSITSQYYGEDGYGLLLKADVTMRYVGN